MPKRIIGKVGAGYVAKCHCGLLAAYIVRITFTTKNRFGLPHEVTALRSYCSTHGKLYAARHKLEVQR
jgi:hypothetical protein